MKNIPALFILFTIAFPSVAISEKLVTVYGEGSDSCGSYTLALSENTPTGGIELNGKDYYSKAAAYSQWVAGFVTANNFSGRRVSSHIDFNGMSMWIKSYCENKPTETIAHAAEAFVKKHKSKK
jgi:hypothetical protein